VKAERAEWPAHQPALEVTQLVFLDETGVSTTMTRTRGRAPVGERCVASVPHGHWKTTTCSAGLRVGAVSAPLLRDGAMDGEAFLGYRREFLGPTLHPGDIVIADNLRRHTVEGVREASEAQGATLRSVPPSSPDLNPIEKLFSTLQALRRKAAHRTVDALWEAIATLLDTFSATECANYFKSSGYNA